MDMLAKKADAIKRKRAMKKHIWQMIEDGVQGTPMKVFVGLDNYELREYVRGGKDFLYADNSYFDRGPRSGNFRLIRNATHLTTVLPEQPGRAVNVPAPEPWKVVEPGRTRQQIVVIPPSPYLINIWDEPHWLRDTVEEIHAYTSKPVIIKYDKQRPLREYLEKHDAYAVVTYASVAGVEAALWGYPVFAGERCPAKPVSAGAIKDIAEPKYPERGPWLRSLAYANWSVNSIGAINLKEYNYQCVA